MEENFSDKKIGFDTFYENEKKFFNDLLNVTDTKLTTRKKRDYDEIETAKVDIVKKKEFVYSRYGNLMRLIKIKLKNLSQIALITLLLDYLLLAQITSINQKNRSLN